MLRAPQTIADAGLAAEGGPGSREARPRERAEGARPFATQHTGREAQGTNRLRLTIPNDPALVDATLFGQGAFRTPEGELELTNGIRVEIGAR